MQKRLLATLATCLLAVAVAMPAAHAAASTKGANALGSPLRFTFIQYNSPGDDLPVTNKKLNEEFVTIYNPTSIARPLSGFRVHDTAGHVYRGFGSLKLGPGHSVRVHTGSGRNTSTNRYWGQSYYVWNNTGDTAFLVANTGATVDTCHWGDGPGSIHC
ncbi:MAG: hypothetical protein QOI06_2716 [Nocardioidaceae bacterium]|jgi:hypothetical protein|nr:hypothetical protein [Nocardioidaceae bacterium]